MIWVRPDDMVAVVLVRMVALARRAQPRSTARRDCLDWAVKEHAADTASTCIRSGLLARTLIFHARVKARPRSDGTHLRKRNPKTQARLRSRVCPGSRRPSWLRGRFFTSSGA